MAIIEGWLPPSRERWELVSYLFQFLPVITAVQWFISWYGMGKTSVVSRFNIPGKIGWLTMEAPGFLLLLYLMLTLPAQTGIAELPWENKTMAALFVIHYLYRAILYPILAPSMSPIHALVWVAALAFQLCNCLSIGGWLGGYGPTTHADWLRHPGAIARVGLGLLLWALGFLLNILHDDELREIRRAAARELKRKNPSTGKGMVAGAAVGGGVDKVYVIPRNWAFRWILFPHYLFEWLEWAGFWLMGGAEFVPGRTFVINEIAVMLPRALQGKRWYIERFGKDKMAGRKAIIPGIL